ncbi:MAG: FtsX-like permease family protein, partial [Vicinamibacterales bacterium]
GIEAAHREVTPDYFKTMRVPVLRGREFTAQDRSGSMPVVVINESLARRHFQGQDPIGQRVAFTRAPGSDTSWKTIVGVVADERQSSLAGDAPLQFTEPFDQRPSSSMQIVIRTAGAPETLIAPVRALVAELDANLPIAALRTMDEVRAESLERERFLLALLLAFAVVGCLLAIVGVYGVMAQFARSRSREMGIRLALGASPGDVRRLVLLRGLKLAAVGMTIGFGGAMAATGTLRAFLFKVEPTDPVTFASVAVLLFVTAITATSIPAWRVSRTNPATTMRDE